VASWNGKHKVTWSRGIRSWTLDRTLYLSVPFTWLVAAAEHIAREHDGPVIAGGPGVELLYPDGCEWAEVQKDSPFDTLAMHNPLAMRTTRGCPNACYFCAVPRLEGEFRELPLPEADVKPIICDDNLLAASEDHIFHVVQCLRRKRFPSVDFNQGLDAQLFRPWHAKQFASLHAVGTKPILRFSLDSNHQVDILEHAIARALFAGFPKRRIRVFVLIGYSDSPENARYRCEKVREWGLKPNPMRYQPLDALDRNAYVAPGWTAELLQKTCRYYARDIFKHIPFDEFQAEEPHHSRQTTLWPGEPA
jgi:hypothetical protein